MKNILVIDSTTGVVTLCTSTEEVEYKSIISPLQDFKIPTDKLVNLKDKVLTTLKEIGFDGQIETKEHVEPDMVINVCDTTPFIWCDTPKYIKSIFISEPLGNCVDKFMIRNMNTFTANIHRNAGIIENGLNERKKEGDYHNSSVFEADFAALTRIREQCEKMADKIRRLQENLTNANYTS